MTRPSSFIGSDKRWNECSSANFVGSNINVFYRIKLPRTSCSSQLKRTVSLNFCAFIDYPRFYKYISMLDVYEKLPVCHDIEDAKLRTKDVILNEEIPFSSLLLEEPIQKGLAKCGYKFLSPIQRNALPLALTGNCKFFEERFILCRTAVYIQLASEFTAIIVHAKSGTGKTLVYLLTALNSYLKLKSEGLFALILAPTREIAKQVYDVCKNVSSFIEGPS